MKKAVLLGINDGAALWVARELSRMGFQVDMICWENHFALNSSYFSSYYVLSDIYHSVNTFVDESIQLLKSKKYDFLIPINDAAIEICKAYQDELIQSVQILGLPDEATYLYAHNKYELWKKAKEWSIPVPDTTYIDQVSEPLPDSISYPAIVKPISSKVILKDRMYSFSVRNAENASQLQDIIRETVPNIPIMVQQKIPGFGTGYNVLSTNGNPIISYCHMRIHEPVDGGQSSYRKVINGDKYGLKNYGEKLLQSIHWTGVAMIEFKVNQQKPYLMELNGRYWGSIGLGIFAGHNIIKEHIKPYIKEHQEKLDSDKLPREVFARNLKLDVRYLVTNILRKRSLFPLLWWIASWRHFLTGKELIEEIRISNLRMEISYMTNILRRWGTNFAYHLYHRRKAIQSPFDIREGMKIGFICYGNICRSPFAVAYARSKYANHDFFSFGLHPHENRMPPINALKAAELQHIDLSTHSSRKLQIKDVKQLDHIYMMDYRDHFLYCQEFPDYVNKAHLLNPTLAIRDPYGTEIGTFEKIYVKIARSIDVLLDTRKSVQ